MQAYIGKTDEKMQTFMAKTDEKMQMAVEDRWFRCDNAYICRNENSLSADSVLLKGD